MATNSEKATTAAEPGREVAMVKARLPWHSRFEEEFKELGVNKGSWRTLVEAIWPAAKSVESVQMALSYCKARNLDPFKRPVHIVPVWSSALGSMVETVWPGIAELRTTATRTKSYAGMHACEFGPTRKEKFKNEKGEELEVEFPEWARITVRKVVAGAGVMDFPGPMVRWLETYATESRKSDWPNAMWRKRPFGQIEKCAEAGTLRRAFPEEIGNDLTAEEMEGQAWHGDAASGVVIEHEQDYREGKGPPSAPPPVKGKGAIEDKREIPMEQVRERDEPEEIDRPEPEQEEETLQAEEVPETERRPAPKPKPKAAAPKEEPEKKSVVDAVEEEFQLIVKSLQVALKQCAAEESEGPLHKWVTASKDDRKALMGKSERHSTDLKQLLALAYENPEGGPAILEKALKGRKP